MVLAAHVADNGTVLTTELVVLLLLHGLCMERCSIRAWTHKQRCL